MGIALGEDFTKYHGKREKVAKVNGIVLTLSDTHRCARMRDAAARTISNLTKGEVAGAELEQAADELHQHCRLLAGIMDDQTKTRRG